MITPSQRAANHKRQLGANPCLCAAYRQKEMHQRTSSSLLLLLALGRLASMAICRASAWPPSATTTMYVLITAGRRMVEGRPCAEGGSRGPVLPVVRARHPCPPMSEPMPSASELLHHSMIRMVRRTTAMAGCAGLLCRFEILQGLAQYCLGQSSSPRSRN